MSNAKRGSAIAVHKPGRASHYYRHEGLQMAPVYRVGPSGKVTKEVVGHEVLVRNNLDLAYTTPDAAIKDIKTATKGLVEPTVQVDSYEEYGSSVTHIYVEGWRKATLEEVAWYDLAAAEQAVRNEANQQQQLQRARETLAKLDPSYRP